MNVAFTAHQRNLTTTVKMQRTSDCRLPSSSGYLYRTAPALKAQATSQKKRKQKGCKNQRTENLL